MALLNNYNQSIIQSINQDLRGNRAASNFSFQHFNISQLYARSVRRGGGGGGGSGGVQGAEAREN